MSQSAAVSRLRGGSNPGQVMHAVTVRKHNLARASRTEHAYQVAVLSGAFDETRAPALREQLLCLLRPAASRLVLDLSRVSDVDAAGLAVLVGTERRARLLGGCLRLAALKPAVGMALRAAGLDRLLEIFPTVESAVTSPARA